ncbi:hypothetical protein KFZ56_01180 [Virgibacillus sp. NKC19-3]|uniref:TrlF family AAA-like ATPase n=1 Tax=Virgibacillus saliphilus TaxID=2831674 RepID=UPI001C9B7E1D|nr:PHP domain-containing protein [Virgibacillus sp. NKC19-3]MBY7141726.1 hypothetical protein [Virgibacillus sp. NKC19-3]
MFERGTEWIRADFHLHTRADKEFSYSGEGDRFISDYIEKLKEEKINLGVITNHNKFDLSEYKAMRKKANKEGITILPGVELSVKEGSNGIHCLIIFKPEDWINGKGENINQFLDEVFKNIENREHENTRCNEDLVGTVKCLDSYNKDYFILMAHIEQKSGFYEECKGGLIETLSRNEWFKEKVLGFQKGRTRDKMKQLEQWMGYKLPYIEGSDCKTIDQIGKGKNSFIKIGDGSFDSVVLAFKDSNNRVSLQPKEVSHGYIKSIEFKGGKMDNQKIDLSPELNSLIGIRGSGKSSIIEAIRYALDILPSKSDEAYKKEVVKNLLESGGEILLTLQDNFQKQYKIRRIWGESHHVLDEDEQEVGAKVNSVLQAPLYFGQKDLSSMDNGFELNLLNKLVGDRTRDSKEKIYQIDEKLSNKIRELFDANEKISNIIELRENLQDVQHKIKIFEEKGLSKKLSKQVRFQKDKVAINNVYETVKEFIKNIGKLVNSKELIELDKFKELKSEESVELFNKLSKETSKVFSTKKELVKIKETLDKSSKEIERYQEEIQKTIESHEEEFAEIKREINIPNLDPDDFAKLKVKEEKIDKSIKQALDEQEGKSKIETEIRSLSDQRNQALLEEFNAYKEEIDKINSSQASLELSIDFKGNKEYFFEKLKEIFKGTKINQEIYRKISESFSDFTSLLIDVLLDNSKEISEIITENQLTKVKEKIRDNYVEYLKIAVPNQIEIKYHGKPIAKHSIGQRASALVLFILSQKENNLIMIDQPEDDLDNQVIYNEIIKEIKARKSDVQFIFATHNANIPVLGDSEQVIAVSYDEKKINIEKGSIDKKEIQNKIVDIMEGGQEAFNKRTQIYNLWKK